MRKEQPGNRLTPDGITAGALDARVASSAADQDAVADLFERIAAAEGWQPGDQLRAHVGRSTYLALYDGGGRTIGGVQLIQPDAYQHLPAHLVWPELPLAGADTLHVAVLAVLPEWRGRDRAVAFWTLAAAVWRHAVSTGAQTLWLEATPTMRRCYRLLGYPLIVQGELREHWGEPCYPCRMSVREVAGALAERALASTTYQGILTRAVAR